jgi:hypothetical protein
MRKIKALATGAIALAGTAGFGGVAQAATVTHGTAGNGTTASGVKTFKQKAATASPDSAFGCNQDVCISIAGNGTYVAYWATAAFPTYGYRCTDPYYWSAGRIIYTGPPQCRASSYYQSAAYVSDNWATSNVQVCNTWAGIPGKPCETIK